MTLIKPAGPNDFDTPALEVRGKYRKVYIYNLTGAQTKQQVMQSTSACILSSLQPSQKRLVVKQIILAKTELFVRKANEQVKEYVGNINVFNSSGLRKSIRGA